MLSGLKSGGLKFNYFRVLRKGELKITIINSKLFKKKKRNEEDISKDT